MAQALFITVAILLAIFWLVQMIDLMRSTDNAFVGKYDKVLWVAVLLAANVLGAFAFYIVKPRPEMIPMLDLDKPREDYPERCLKCGKQIPPNAKKCPACGWSYQNKQ
jgi:hypothetical protein